MHVHVCGNGAGHVKDHGVPHRDLIATSPRSHVQSAAASLPMAVECHVLLDALASQKAMLSS